MTKANPFHTPRARFFDSNGNPLANGRVSFYIPGTTTLKAVYTTREGDVAATNPAPLDAEGYVRDGGIWLGSGEYKVVLEASDGGGGFTEEWTVDNVPGSTIAPSGILESTYVIDIASLRALDAGLTDLVYVSGYYDNGDSGGGWFRWDGADATADDAGSTIQPDSVPIYGRWKRNFDSTEITPYQWGAMASAPSVVEGRIINMTAFAAANLKYRNIVIPPSTYDIGADITLSGNITITIQEGAQFTTANPAQTVYITCQEAFCESREAIAGSNISLEWTPVNKSDAKIEWWGADPTGVSNSYDAFVGATYNGKLILDGTYLITRPLSGSITISRPHFVYGSSINLAGSANNFIIDSYTADNKATDIFKGDWKDLDWTAQNEFISSHFELTTAGITNTELTDLYDCITRGETVAAKLHWTGYNYVFGTAYTNTGYKIYTTVDVGYPLKIDATTYLGTLRNGPEAIFTTTSTSSPHINNQVWYVQWWGAYEGVDTAAQTSLLNALTTIQAGAYTTDYWISGAGGEWLLESSLQPTEAMKLRDFFLDDNVSGGDPIVQFDYDGTMKDCTIINGDILINAGNTPTVRFDTCYINPGASTTAIQTDLETTLFLDNCEVVIASGYTNAMLPRGTMIIKGTEFRSDSDSTNATFRVICGGQLTAINSSTFRNITVQVEEAQNFVFRGNTMISVDTSNESVVSFTAASSGTLAQGVICTDNVFYMEDATPVSLSGNPFTQGANYAATGHYAVSIIDNLECGAKTTGYVGKAYGTANSTGSGTTPPTPGAGDLFWVTTALPANFRLRWHTNNLDG